MNEYLYNSFDFNTIEKNHSYMLYARKIPSKYQYLFFYLQSERITLDALKEMRN